MTQEPSPTISVVIPLYNKGPFVERAVQSVLRQTCQDFEIVVVNDGSTDAGPGSVERLGDSRIRLISQSNAGVSAARNRGIKEARASLVAFLDADDEWEPEFLATILRLRARYPECAVFATGYVLCYDDGRTRRPILRGIAPEPWEGVLADYFAIAARGDPPLWTSAVAVKKSAIDDIGGFPVGIAAGEDLLTWARLAVRWPIAYARVPRAVFHAGSVFTLHRSPSLEDPVGKELTRLLKQHGKTLKGLRGYVALWHKMRASCFMRAGRPSQAAKECLFSLRCSPTNWKVYCYLVLCGLPKRARHCVLRLIYTVR